MLERLVVRDLAVVEHAEIVFGAGLNAVTGETGAGKTLLVQAVSLLVGERADSDVVREGAESAVVEGEFRLAGEPARRAGELLSAWGHAWDGETVIVRREIGAGGRSRASVNQSPVTLAALKSLGECLADLHGQHEHQSLLRPEAGMLVLDRLAGLDTLRAETDQALAVWQEAAETHAKLETSLASFAERADFLQHAARELDEARLAPGEEEELARDAARLAHADRLRALVATALERLTEADDAAQASLGTALRSLEQAATLDPSLADTLPALREAGIALSDTARALAEYADGLEADPEALEAVEARRDLIARLTRKYHRAVPELIAWRAEMAREVADAGDAEGARARSLVALDRAARAARHACAQLDDRRREAAATWGPRLSAELAPLGMRAARIEFAVETPGSDPARIEPAPVAVRFGPNPGEPPRPLARIASGGELSRVMLAIKGVMDARDRVDLLFFDEVDSGIGGVVAQAVGERLRRLARHRQIVCVTHLPLIAALAGHHLRVVKQVRAGRTVARIEPVDGPERVTEIARMLAGDRVTETTRRQARELLDAPSGHPAR
ncbi:MAG: DNA repair protein RecN [Candidatus Eisenbacteria bacterium]